VSHIWSPYVIVCVYTVCRYEGCPNWRKEQAKPCCEEGQRLQRERGGGGREEGGERNWQSVFSVCSLCVLYTFVGCTYIECVGCKYIETHVSKVCSYALCIFTTYRCVPAKCVLCVFFMCSLYICTVFVCKVRKYIETHLSKCVLAHSISVRPTNVFRSRVFFVGAWG